MAWWLVHTAGNSDLGVSSARDHRDSSGSLLAGRLDRLRTTTDGPTLAGLLHGTSWDGPVSGAVSPLGQATEWLPLATPARLVLVSTAHTAQIAHAIDDVLRRAPQAYGRRFEAIDLVEVGGADGGLTEAATAAALRAVLPVVSAAAVDPDCALITWGSGSTQLTLNVLDAVLESGMPWRLGTVAPTTAPARYQVFDPIGQLRLDPLVPLLRRWRYHDQLAALVESGQVAVNDEQRAVLVAGAARWRDAHLRPTADGLRLVMADALARGDASSGFAIRRYVFARYHELRELDPTGVDLERWATELWRRRHPNLRRGPQLGEILGLLPRKPRPALQPAMDSPAGLWLQSTTVKALNKVGIASSHRLGLPEPRFTAELRTHLAGFRTSETTVDGLPPLTAVPATAAWYVALISKNRSGDARPELLRDIAEQGAHPVVGSYLGVPASEVALRFLVLGTEHGSRREAEQLCTELNDRHPGAAAADVVPDPGADPPLDAEHAYAVLARQFQGVADDVGAIVLVPSGLKVLVLPLIVAAQRLAAEQGIPFYLRHLSGDGPMHRLPVRFGSDLRLLNVVLYALSTVELDVAARLLDAYSGGQDLAERARRLANVLCCRTGRAQQWPDEFGTPSAAWRSTGLIAQRIRVWAELADTHSDSTHLMRALFGGCAVIEEAVRHHGGEPVWKQFRQQLSKATNDPAAAATMSLLFDTRNALPVSHGAALPSVAALDALVSESAADLGGRLGGVAALVRAAAEAATRWPGFGTVTLSPGQPSLGMLLGSLAEDVRLTRDAEILRQARRQAGEAVVAARFGGSSS